MRIEGLNNSGLAFNTSADLSHMWTAIGYVRPTGLYGGFRTTTTKSPSCWKASQNGATKERMVSRINSMQVLRGYRDCNFVQFSLGNVTVTVRGWVGGSRAAELDCSDYCVEAPSGNGGRPYARQESGRP